MVFMNGGLKKWTLNHGNSKTAVKRVLGMVSENGQLLTKGNYKEKKKKKLSL